MRKKIDISVLAEQVAWHNTVLTQLGIEPWVNLHQASHFLGMPYRSLRHILEVAEQSRQQGKHISLVYGEHYRRVPVQAGKWQYRVHLPRLQSWLNTPPEKWDVDL